MIRVGPAGWSYRDWEGIVYPAPKPLGFQPLALIARMFDLVEVNATFYHPPRAQTGAGWCDLLDRLEAERFRFSVKLWQGLTHGVEAPKGDEVQNLRTLCELLHERGRLAAILAQFPWSFKNSPVSRARLTQIVEEWGEFGLAVEVRHGSWADEAFLQWLREGNVAFVNIDQPVIGESLEPSAHVTSPALAYVRLHGRNRDAWFSEEADRDQRYNYRYTPQELAPWVHRIGHMSAETQETVVVANNHFQGQAVANALELQAATCPERVVPVPATLIESVPELREVPGLRIAAGAEFEPPPMAEKGPGQLDLF